MLVTGYDDRSGCGYAVRTGPHAGSADPGSQPVAHDGVTVLATPEIAAALRDALARRVTARLSWTGPEVPLSLDDTALLGWLRHEVGGVLTVVGEPGAQG